MNKIERALAEGDDMDKAVDAEILRYAVAQQIMCPGSGVVLDVRTAVLFEITNEDGKSASRVVDGAFWDTIAEKTQNLCAEQKCKLEIIDGRLL